MGYLTVIIVLVLLLSATDMTFCQRNIDVVASERDELLPETFYRKSWALIIGIDKYPHLPVQFQLNYSVADAEAVAEVLKSRFGFKENNVKILTDEKATKQGIMDAISDHIDPNSVNENDCLFFFFAGHGQTVPLPVSGGSGEMGFLIPYDAQVDVSNQPNAAHYDRYCIPMEELVDKAKLIPAKHIIFIMDACYSGLVLESYRGIGSNVAGYLEKVTSVPVRQIITAGGDGEIVVELPDIGHGLFTYKLIEGLESEFADINHDGIITGVELSGYLSSTVPVVSNNRQIPQFAKRGEGDFVFSPRLGLLQIQVEPSDAIVTADSMGKSKKSYLASGNEMKLPFGTYCVRAERDGYEPAKEDNIVIADRKTVHLSLALKPKPGIITAQSSPVVLGKVSTQITPTDSKVKLTPSGLSKWFPLPTTGEVPVGIYDVTIKRAGYHHIERKSIEIEPDEATFLEFSLIPRSRWKASVQSMIWPGWGDLPDRKISGILMSVIQIGTISGAVLYHLDYSAKLDEYEESLMHLKNLDNFSSYSEYRAYRLVARSKRDDALMAGRLRDTLFFSAVIGVRIVGAIEAAAFMPRASSDAR